MYEFTAWLPTRRFWARVPAFWQINKGWEWQEMVLAALPTSVMPGLTRHPTFLCNK
jgi:hypothetical protein